jgi:exosortase/archaeosortase family protein
MTLGFIAAYFFKGAFWKRAVIFLSTIPITVIMNSLRIGAIGVMVEYWGKAMAEGFLYDFEGWVVFMACTAVLVGEMWVLARLGARALSAGPLNGSPPAGRHWSAARTAPPFWLPACWRLLLQG